MFLRQTAGELILVDKDSYRAEGEAMDLMHGQPYVGNISVRAGDYPDLGKAQVVVIAAGAAQRPGEKRTDLLNRNVDIFRKIVSQLDRHAPNAVIIVASNPVDILSYAIHELSARPSQQIIGTGTMLDTARFRSLLGSYYGVDPGSVHAYIIGEHGDPPVLHADNGGPQKGFTMKAKLEALGITPSYSRPRVSNDNPYSESLFRTFKYRPEYPVNGFESIEAARRWVNRFVKWYNEEHRHSAIRYVTLSQRHKGQDIEILANRHQVYQQSRQRRQDRWSGPTRTWEPIEAVWLNCPKDAETCASRLSRAA